MKDIIVDYIPFEVTPQQINESINENNGRLVVKGVLQRAEAKNQNGRVYPKEILVREAKKYSEVQISERRALGELDHPDSSVVNLNNVSHNVLEMHWDGNDLMGTVEVLATPAGNILKELFKSGSYPDVYITGSVMTAADAGPIRLDISPVAWGGEGVATGDVTFVYVRVS